MANDAKLGLVLGVAIVVVIGIIFFRTEPAMPRTADEVSHSATLADGEMAPASRIAAKNDG